VRDNEGKNNPTCIIFASEFLRKSYDLSGESQFKYKEKMKNRKLERDKEDSRKKGFSEPKFAG
jgi:hypothetical protein